MIHEYKDNFKELIEYLSQTSGIRADVLEKDYYVSLLLNELAQMQNQTKAYFKGGTALYKISKEMRRFSEDIDITVDVTQISNSQAKKMLKKSSEGYQTLALSKDDEMTENRKGSITSVYKYESLFGIRPDPLQRYGKVKVEATSFTISDPTDTYTIEPLIYTIADNDIRELLDKLNCRPFKIQTISLQRMFTDKILAAEYYLEREKYFDVAKHLYDIDFLMSQPEIQKLLNNTESFIQALSYKRMEEYRRIGSDLDCKPLQDLILCRDLDNSDLISQYNIMTNIYVFNDKYRTSFPHIKDSISQLSEKLCEISEEEQIYLNSIDFIELCNRYKVDTKDDISVHRIEAFGELEDIER